MNQLEQARDAVLERKSLEDMKTAGHDMQEAVRAAEQAVQAARDLIDGLPDAEQRAVCRYRYLLAYTWQDTASAMGCDMSTVFRRHRRAMRNLGFKA